MDLFHKISGYSDMPAVLPCIGGKTMAEPSAPQGFSGGQMYKYEGDLSGLPDWADKGWATYDRGPALAVPRGDPFGQPYSTVVARIGDYIFVNKRGDRFTVVRAEELGEEPGEETTEPQKPAQETQASLEDLDRTGFKPYEDLNIEAKSQMLARGTVPPDKMPEEGEPSREAEATPRRRRKSASSE
jgi:hypothetical protein